LTSFALNGAEVSGHFGTSADVLSQSSNWTSDLFSTYSYIFNVN